MGDDDAFVNDDGAFVVPVPVRFRDLDTMGHVNNAVYVTYLEEARVAYFEDALDLDLTTVPSVVAHLEIDYERPITGGRDVEVAVTIPDLGETSIPTEYEIRADGRTAATAETVQVLLDGSNDPRPIPEDIREQITGHPSYRG